MHISAKVDYACRALCSLAASDGGPLTADEISKDQDIPVRFLRSILNELRRVGIVSSQRGSEGGYRLARRAEDVTLGEVVRRLEGPLAEVRNERPEDACYRGSSEHLQEVWIALRAALRSVLDEVTLAEVVTDTLPAGVTTLLGTGGAWQSR